MSAEKCHWIDSSVDDSAFTWLQSRGISEKINETWLHFICTELNNDNKKFPLNHFRKTQLNPKYMILYVLLTMQF